MFFKRTVLAIWVLALAITSLARAELLTPAGLRVESPTTEPNLSFSKQGACQFR